MYTGAADLLLAQASLTGAALWKKMAWQLTC